MKNTRTRGESSYCCKIRINNYPCHGRGMIKETAFGCFYVQCSKCGFITQLNISKTAASVDWDARPNTNFSYHPN